MNAKVETFLNVLVLFSSEPSIPECNATVRIIKKTSVTMKNSIIELFTWSLNDCSSISLLIMNI